MRTVQGHVLTHDLYDRGPTAYGSGDPMANVFDAFIVRLQHADFHQLALVECLPDSVDDCRRYSLLSDLKYRAKGMSK